MDRSSGDILRPVVADLAAQVGLLPAAARDARGGRRASARATGSEHERPAGCEGCHSVGTSPRDSSEGPSPHPATVNEILAKGPRGAWPLSVRRANRVWVVPGFIPTVFPWNVLVQAIPSMVPMPIIGPLMLSMLTCQWPYPDTSGFPSRSH